MQFSKFMPLVCAAVFCAGFFSVHAQDNPAQAAARAALDEKMHELDAQQVSTNVTPQPAVAATPSGAAQAQPAATADTAAQARAMEALQEKMSELDRQQKAEATASASSDNTVQAAARAALEKKMHELNAQQAAMNAAAPPPAGVNYPGKELGLPPITAPPLPISASKEAQLQALLEKYMADLVTPAEYQSNRAKILAEP